MGAPESEQGQRDPAPVRHVGVVPRLLSCRESRKRLVGGLHRPGEDARHEPLLRHLHQQLGRLLWQHGAIRSGPADGEAVRQHVPALRGERPGRRAVLAVGLPRHRAVARVRRLLLGRHAEHLRGGDVPGARGEVRHHLRVRQELPREHRLQTRAAVGDHERPPLEERRLLRQQAAGERPASCPGGRHHHLPLRPGVAAALRPGSLRGRGEGPHHGPGAGVPDRAVSGAPGPEVGEQLRPELAALDLQGHGRVHHGGS
mmetsp:Transcript_117382/g.328578  ORF Transcript_117382/g.328578 Transcript_117382/m.328578 type:complete len:258 (+) Transcript_117382:318-1091(+)